MAPIIDAGPLDDATALGVLRAIHQEAITLAEHASTHAARPDVRQFAERMVMEHTAANARLAAIGSAEGLSFEPSQESAAIEARTATQLAHLSTMTGIDVDLSYTASAYALEWGAVALIGRALVPVVTNAALSAEIESELTDFMANGTEAESLQRTDGFPEAGFRYDAGPTPDAAFDVGVDA